MKRGNNFCFIAAAAVTSVLLSFSFNINAQQQDSLSPGVLKVRRPPVPSEFRIALSYSYNPGRNPLINLHLGNARLERQAMAMQRDMDNLAPPQPVSLPKRDGDSVNALRDSSFMIRYARKNDRPVEFDWITWINQYEHYFTWSDTGTVDSVVFVYSVNRNGNVNFSASPVDPVDTSAARLQRNLTPAMRSLWIWYPALWFQGESKRQKQVGCVVTVKIYAVRDDKQPEIPLKIVE